MTDSAFSPNIVRDFVELKRRLLNLETSSRGVRTVDAGGDIWDDLHPDYVDPGGVPLWHELRVKNPVDGVGQIWRTVPTPTGAEWRRVV